LKRRTWVCDALYTMLNTDQKLQEKSENECYIQAECAGKTVKNS